MKGIIATIITATATLLILSVATSTTRVVKAAKAANAVIKIRKYEASPDKVFSRTMDAKTLVDNSSHEQSRPAERE